MNWLQEMTDLTRNGRPFALVTVLETTGSAPREVGSRMVVTTETSTDTIGGGNLEFHAIERARELLTNSEEPKRFNEFFGLGITMNQCCGGAVRLLYEVFDEHASGPIREALDHADHSASLFLVSPLKPSVNLPTQVVSWRGNTSLPNAVKSAIDDLLQKNEISSKLVKQDSEEWFVSRLDENHIPLALFGAGHVGKAVIHALENLPFQIFWVDERAAMFPTAVPANTQPVVVNNTLEGLEQIPANALYLIMTHNHGLDYQLCLKIFQSENFAWLGLIGSKTKRFRFEKRFLQDGIGKGQLQHLVCPIGLPNLPGKSPAVIAASVTVQLLEARQKALLERQSQHFSESHATIASRI